MPWCFGCGPENADRLGVEPAVRRNRVVAELRFAPRFQGGPGVVHGGATAAFFDDLMGHVLIAHGSPAVTAKLEVNYLRPIPLGVTLSGEAWLAERDGRKLWVEAIGHDGRGVDFVEARGLFLTIGPEHYAAAGESVEDLERWQRLARYDRDEYYP
jgi:uncharacterized protein (TIGR00369 family)